MVWKPGFEVLAVWYISDSYRSFAQEYVRVFFSGRRGFCWACGAALGYRLSLGNLSWGWGLAGWLRMGLVVNRWRSYRKRKELFKDSITCAG